MFYSKFQTLYHDNHMSFFAKLKKVKIWFIIHPYVTHVHKFSILSDCLGVSTMYKYKNEEKNQQMMTSHRYIVNKLYIHIHQYFNMKSELYC